MLLLNTDCYRFRNAAKLLLKPPGPKHFIKNYTSEKRNYLLFHSNPGDLLKRRFPVRRNERKTQVTEITQNNSQLDVIIQKAIASTGSNTTIVIINQSPALTPNLDQLLDEGINKNQNCNASSPGIISQKRGMTFEDIPGLINITQSIGVVYDGYYKAFPEKSTFLSQNSADQTMDQVANILSFYGKVRKFVVSVLEEKEQIVHDINVIRANISALQTSEMDMMRFFGLDKRYSEVKLKSAAYEAFDPKFNIYYMSMVDMTVNFQINLKNALMLVVDLENYTQMFFSAVDELTKIGFNRYDDELLNVVSKIDTVLMFLGSLAEIKFQLEVAIQYASTALEALMTERKNLVTTIDNISNLADYYALKNPVTNSILKAISKLRLGLLIYFVVPTLLLR